MSTEVEIVSQVDIPKNTKFSAFGNVGDTDFSQRLTVKFAYCFSCPLFFLAYIDFKIHNVDTSVLIYFLHDSE